MGGLFSPPSPPAPAPVAPPPAEDDPKVEEARRTELRAAAGRRGRRDTLLTGGAGVQESAGSAGTMLTGKARLGD